MTIWLLGIISCIICHFNCHPSFPTCDLHDLIPLVDKRQPIVSNPFDSLALSAPERNYLFFLFTFYNVKQGRTIIFVCYCLVIYYKNNF